MSSFQPEEDFIQKKLQDAFKNSHITRVRSNIHKDNDIYGNYYRLIFQILKYIAYKVPNSSYPDKIHPTEQEKFYASILRSLINHSRTQVLAINACCLKKEDSFHEYMVFIKRYSFLEHMPLEIKTDNSNVKDNSKIYFSSLFYIYRNDAFNKSDFLRNHINKNSDLMKKGKNQLIMQLDMRSKIDI